MEGLERTKEKRDNGNFGATANLTGDFGGYGGNGENGGNERCNHRRP